MKKYLYSLLPILLMAVSVQAQVHHPEFWLEMKWFVNDNPGQNRVIAFGYDPIARDSIAQRGKVARDSGWLRDSTWLDDIIGGGEQLAPGPGANSDYAAFTGYTIDRQYMESGAYVDIRQKPSSPSFTRTYEISIARGDGTNSFSFIWDKSKIPAIINHIMISPAPQNAPGRTKMDMEQFSRLDIPKDSIGVYSKMLITLYYNQELGVNDDVQAYEGLALTVYPNPMQEKSTIVIQTPHTGMLQMEVYDPLGRKILDRSIRAIVGTNAVELYRNEFPAAGLYYVRVHTTTGGGLNTITKAFQVF